PFTEADSDISFPAYPDYSATFTSLDQVILGVAVDGPATSLAVSGDGQSFGDVSISGGEGSFNSSLSDLGLAAGSSIELAFATAESKRLFDVDVVNPISMGYTVGTGTDAVDFETSSTVYLDSTYNIYFEAETVNGQIDNYQIFTKIGSESEYDATPDQEVSVNSTEIVEESITLDADSAVYDLGDTIYYNLVLNAGTLSASKGGTVIVTEVALPATGTVTLRTPDYDLGGGKTDSLKNAFNFSALKIIADSVLATSPDSADIRLEVIAGDLALSAGVGSNTEFVVAEETFAYSSAGYESVRDAFDSGISFSTLTNIESLYTNAVILVRIGNIPNDDYPSADNKRYAVIQITDIVKADDGETSEVTFNYKAPKQAK
ncbi:hypothetical protein, partial [Fulvivirga aurantia]|uniref:hypothetical protein n=1 Tax=Fulvivirga aurantia TaxID=2529383 RepID=UPI001627EF9C